MPTLGDERIVATIQAALVDLDGVVYAGERTLPGAVEFFATLRADGRSYAFLTNNSTRTPEHFVERLARLGIPADAQHVITSAEAAAGILARERPGASVYVIGEEGLRAAFERRGCTVTAELPHYVVVGLDRKFDYEKLRLGTAAVRAGAQFVASNTDPLLPTADGFIPGAGAMVAALAAASGVQPRVIGKPNPDMVLLALERLRVPPQQALMVGDRLDTDVAAGCAAGTRTALVLSGVARAEDLDSAAVRPDLVVEHLGALGAIFARYPFSRPR